MSITLEKDVEHYLKREVEKRGGKCIKFFSAAEIGIPDRIVILPEGRITFVELKKPDGGKVSEIQKYQIAKLKKLGVNALVLKSAREIDKFLDRELFPNEKQQSKSSAQSERAE